MENDRTLTRDDCARLIKEDAARAGARITDAAVLYMAAQPWPTDRSFRGAVGRVITESLLRNKKITPVFAYGRLKSADHDVQIPNNPDDVLTKRQQLMLHNMWMMNYKLHEIAEIFNIPSSKLVGLAQAMGLPAQKDLRFTTLGVPVEKIDA